jgi:hypothetical protein
VKQSSRRPNGQTWSPVIFICDVFVAQGLVTQADVAAALEMQRNHGGTLGERLVEMGKIEVADLEKIIHGAPKPPHTIEDTGLSVADLLNLLIKAFYVSGEATPTMMANVLKLPPRAMQELFEEAEERRLLNLLGAVHSGGVSELRYALTEKGVQWAHSAMEQNQYVGPAPVPLEVFCERIRSQRIVNERINHAAINKAFGDLVVSDRLVREVGPAINSGRSVLLYGPPGNGKTSVGERVGSLFKDIIYIPFAFEVEGQIIKVFDPAIHRAIQGAAGHPEHVQTLHREDVDMRWEPCWRPFIVTGGELTLEMLDLSYNLVAKFYEAPLHLKALGGIFLIDDFGRQLVSPTALLNRWIVPMESRVDYLKLHTGKSFSVPFDELVIFSTNLSPHDLMDAAFLRRIPYKIEVSGPSAEEYHRIFRAVANAMGLEVTDEIIDEVITELRVRNDFPLASFQPKFILDQVLSACKFEEMHPTVLPEFVILGLRNLYTKDSPGFGVRGGGA